MESFHRIELGNGSCFKRLRSRLRGRRCWHFIFILFLYYDVAGNILFIDFNCQVFYLDILKYYNIYFLLSS